MLNICALYCSNSRSPGRWKQISEVSGKFNVLFFGIKNIRNIAQTFFLLTIGQDIEAQKNLDQKNHSSLEINSSTVGDIGKKWSKTLSKYSISIGFPLKIKKSMNFTNFLVFNENPIEIGYLGKFCSIFYQCRRR